MRVGFGVVVLLVLLEAVASAQAPKAADDAFEKGRAMMKAGNYREACDAFELSQRLDPQFGTQFNLAGCYVELKKVASAWKLFRELARSDSNLDRRAKAAELEKALALRVSKLKIQVEQQFEGLKVFIGTTDVTALIGAEIPFDLGSYIIAASLPGYLPYREAVNLEQEGKVLTVEVTFQKDPAEDKPVAVASNRRAYGRIAIAGGGALVAVGLFAGWRALVNRDRSRDLCNTMLCPDRGVAEDATARARLWGNVATVSVVLGLAGIGGGIYLWRTSAPARVSATATTETASIIVSGSF